ncbi:MAG: right-handed parallel beta-helix repeat-containing protein, partial [Rhodothermales bacterium]|nr:right-handed parallel beta-helix repeat-containing protein [Rhodothermales bacterium]
VMRFRYTGSDIGNAEDGFFYRAIDGAIVDMPVDGLVRPDGNLATGPVTPSVTPLHVVRTDPFTEIEAFPGTFEGIQSDGNAGLLLTYGAVEVVFEQNGQELQLAPGKVATIEIPIYTAGAEVGQTIPLWSMDEKLGQWVQEGVGTVVESAGSPTGLALRATISHLSWWNCDDFVDEGSVVRTIRCVGGDPAAPVDCWVASNDREDLIDPNDGPLYEVRTFVEAAGRPLIFPNGRNTPVSGIAVFDNGEVWRGVAIVDPDDGTDETVIQLARTEGGGDTEAIAIPSNITASIAVVDEVDNYTFEGPAGQRLFMSGIGIVTAGFTLLDPSGNTVGGGSFGRSNRGTTVAVLPVDGTYTLRIAGASFSVGDYWLSISWLGDPVSLPFRSPRELLAGTNFLNAYTVELTSESVVAAYATGGRVRVNLCTFEDVCIPHGQENLVLAIGQEPGEYLLTLQNIGAAGEYAVRVTEPTDTWAPGTNYSFTLGAKDIVFVGLDTPPEEVLTVFRAPDNPANFGYLGYGARDTDGRITSPIWDDLGWKWTSSSLNLLPPYYMIIEAGSSAPLSDTYEVGLSIPEVIPLTLDADGMVSVNRDLTIYGQRHLYSLDVTAGAGMEFVTRSLTADPGASLGLKLADPVAMTVLDVGSASRGYDEYGPNLAVRAERTGTTAAAVWHQAAALGSYELRAAVVQPSTSIVVEGTQSCGGATTGSLGAALTAVTDGGEVSLCTGTHQLRSSPVVTANGVTFQGQPSGGTEVDVEVQQGYAVGATRDLTIRSMLVRTQSTFFSTVFVSSQDPEPSVILEDLSFVPRTETEPVGTLGGGSVQSAVVRRVTGPGTADFRLNEIGAQVLIEDSDLEGRIDVYCRIGTPQQVTVSGSRFKGADIERCATVEIDGNEIVDETLRLERFDDVFVTDNVFVAEQLVRGMMVVGPGNATITGNTIVGASLLTVGEGNFLVENNLINLAAPSNDIVWRIVHNTTAGPGRVSVRNNVVDNAGVGGFSGYNAIVDVQNADLFESIEFFNNSLRTSTATASGKPAVRFGLRNGTFTGTLPVTFVNNILEGVGGTAVSIPGGTTIDSDYNLFFWYGTVYEGGVSSTGTNDLVEPSDPDNPPPVFVGPLLELDPASPAVDAGAGPGEYPNVPTVDVVGTSRPQGGRYDMGAHEQ